MDDQFLFVVTLISVPNEDVGVKIAKQLIEKKLAACVNILPGMRSIYAWEDRVLDEREVMLLVKTRADIFQSQLVPAVKAAHPYEVPEIIALPIVQGTEEYLGWIDGWVKMEED